MGPDSATLDMVKRLIKKILDILMRGLSLPLAIIFPLLGPIIGRRKAFLSLMQMVSLFPGISGEWLRRGVLQWITGSRLADACISFGTLFSDPDLRIGDGVYIGPRCDIGRVEIGCNTIIGSHVHITSGLKQHMFDQIDIPIRDQGGVFERICIGEDVWIGNGAMISADVGRGCVVGMGSVVVEPIPDYGVAVGNPASVISYRLAIGAEKL